MKHTCVGKLTINGSDNGLSPGRRQAIISTNTGILSITPLGTYFSEILIVNYTFPFKEVHFKMRSAKWCPFCLGLNVLNKYASSAVRCLRNENSILGLMSWFTDAESKLPLHGRRLGDARLLCNITVSHGGHSRLSLDIKAVFAVVLRTDV